MNNNNKETKTFNYNNRLKRNNEIKKDEKDNTNNDNDGEKF